MILKKNEIIIKEKKKRVNVISFILFFNTPDVKLY